MTNPLRVLLDRTKTGFTFNEKAVLAVVACIYALSPIDLVPDFIPVVGQLDDLSVLIVLAKVLMSPTLPPSGGPKGAGAH